MSMDLIQRTFSSLRQRNFRLFFAGQAVSVVGTWIQQTALSWLVYELTGSKYMLGVVAALSSLPMLFLPILGGVIADRFPKKKILLITQFISMFFMIVFAALIVSGRYNINHILIISVLIGTVFAIDMPARHAFVVEIAGKQDLMNAIALNSSMFNLARVIGPAIAGIIMMRLGVSWCFIINAFSFLAVLIALFYVQAAEVPVIKRTESIAQYTLSGFRYVKQNKTILNVMVLMVMMGIFGWSYSVLIPALAKDVFSQGEQGYAMLVSATGLGALFGALFVAYMGNTEHRKRLIDCGVYFFSIMLFLLALSKSYWLSIILLMGTGTGLLVYFSSSTTMIQSCVDDSFRGRIMGIWALIFGGTIPIGSFLVGIVSERFGIALTLLACSIICPLFTFILSLYSKEEVRTEPKELVEAA